MGGKGGKRNKGSKSPDKGDPLNDDGSPCKNRGPPPVNGSPPPEGLPPEEVKPSASSIPDSNVTEMLQGQGFVIVNGDRIKNTAGLSAETQSNHSG